MADLGSIGVDAPGSTEEIEIIAAPEAHLPTGAVDTSFGLELPTRTFGYPAG